MDALQELQELQEAAARIRGFLNDAGLEMADHPEPAELPEVPVNAFP